MSLLLRREESERGMYVGILKINTQAIQISKLILLKPLPTSPAFSKLKIMLRQGHLACTMLSYFTYLFMLLLELCDCTDSYL
jgi:hypothetical protein